MLVNKHTAWPILVVVIVLAGAVFIYGVLAARDPTKKIEHCGYETENAIQADCVFRVITEDLRKGKFTAALEVFEEARNEGFAEFVPGECHRKAHAFGDVLYYEAYLQSGGFDGFSFPLGSTVCSYGIFHGFFEHLFQDNPSVDFVTETCKMMSDKFGHSMRDIRDTCYHAAGHGFTLHQVEKLSSKDFGNLQLLTREPFDICSTLPESSAFELLDECQEGVFNIAINFMTDEEYGFSFDVEEPFKICEEVDEDMAPYCYRETARKLDNVSGYNPITLLSILESAPRPEEARKWFSKSVGGIARRIGFEESLKRCWDAPDSVYVDCVRYVISGLFEGGPIQKEYKEPLRMCAHELVVSRGFEKECYDTIISRLPRYYSSEQRVYICKEFPQQALAACEESL